jgi:hypothetical protein
MRKATGNPSIRSVFERTDRRWTTVVGHGIVKPIVFLATEPIVQVFGLYMAILYGVLYLCLTSSYFVSLTDVQRFISSIAFVRLYTERYHQSIAMACLHYLAIALGSTSKRTFVLVVQSLISL